MTNILNLSRYHVISKKEGDHDYHIDTETINPSKSCLACGSENIVGGGRQEILITDLPMHGKRVGVYVQARRFRCRDCGKTITERLPDDAEGQRMTNRLHKWIGEQSITKTFTSIANEVGISEGLVRLIFKEYVASIESTVLFETPEWMGIDEIHIIKKPRCVITDIEHCTVIDLLPNRDKPLIVNYMMRLPNRHNVKCVTMDMWKPYKDAVYATMPQAFIVIDKFHVLRMANAALEVIRKGVRADLTAKQRRGLMHDRFLLLKRDNNLQNLDRLTLESWTRNYPALGEAYRAKEGFFEFYEAMSIPEAKYLYSEWQNNLSPSIQSAFKPLTTAMKNWDEEIFKYFDCPVTNAYTESLNSLIRVVNRCGRGYSFEALRAKILFTSGAHKIVRPKFQRQPQTDRYETELGLGAAPLHPMRTTEMLQQPKNYGVDLSTLLKLIEKGTL